MICHHAAQIDVRRSMADPRFDADVNVGGLLNLMQGAVEASSVEHVLFASSGGATYGDTDVSRRPRTTRSCRSRTTARRRRRASCTSASTARTTASRSPRSATPTCTARARIRTARRAWWRSSAGGSSRAALHDLRRRRADPRLRLRGRRRAREPARGGEAVRRRRQRRHRRRDRPRGRTAPPRVPPARPPRSTPRRRRGESRRPGATRPPRRRAQSGESRRSRSPPGSRAPSTGSRRATAPERRSVRPRRAGSGRPSRAAAVRVTSVTTRTSLLLFFCRASAGTLSIARGDRVLIRRAGSAGRYTMRPNMKTTTTLIAAAALTLAASLPGDIRAEFPRRPAQGRSGADRHAGGRGQPERALRLEARSASRPPSSPSTRSRATTRAHGELRRRLHAQAAPVRHGVPADEP